MNEERKATGLPEFRQASEETQVLLEHPDSGRKITAATLWSEICKKLAGVSPVIGTLLSPVLGHIVKCVPEPAGCGASG